MKKIFICLFAALFTISVSAQIEKGFRHGARIDLGTNNVLGFDGDNFAFSFGVSYLAEYNFNSNLYLGSGLGFADYSHGENGIDGTIHAWTITLPIHVGYRFEINDNLHLFVQAGPQLGIGVAGSDIDFYSGGSMNWFDAAKRFDLGLGGRVGAEFKKFTISAGVDGGLLEKTDAGGHNFNFNVGIGYMF